MGGEKSRAPGRSRCGAGSPPHGRGKDDVFRGQILLPGITPAWAGKRRAAHGQDRDHQDHPRMGGEKCVSGTWLKCRSGPPPRGRGKAAEVTTSASTSGITPAWAGKRKWCSGCLPAFRDHPRVGGEKCSSDKASIKLEGSPLRGRGKVTQGSGDEVHLRITPA